MKKRKEDSPKVKELKHKARRTSIKEGIFASGRVSFGDRFISPFAIAINSSNSVVAMLSSIAGLLGPLSQTFGSRLIEKYPRKKILRKSVFFEALSWILMIVIAILFYFNILTEMLPLFLLLSFAIFTILVNIGHPAWFSWMGDIVDIEYRGRWFSKRNLLTGFVSIVIAILASFFLEYFKENHLTMEGFVILFSLALFARLVSWKLFKKQYEPKIKLEKGYYFSFWEFLLSAKKNNFGKFTWYRFYLNLACSISSPLIAVYLLRSLGFDYPLYMAITLAGTFFSLIVLELWGKFADKYGNYVIFCLTSITIPVIPVLWILHSSPIYLLLIPPIVGGISWAGFDLAAGNFVYDNVSQQKRGLAVSYMNVMGGIGTFIGAGIGAILIKFILVPEALVIIFLISAVARMASTFYWIPKLREVQKKRKFESKSAFKRIILKEGKPTLIEEMHEIASIKNYFYHR